MRDLPLTALYQTSALKITPATSCQEAEDSLQVSVERRALEPCAHTNGKTHRYRHKHAKNKKKSLVFQKDLQTIHGRLLHHSVIILDTQSQLLADNLIFTLQSMRRSTHLAFAFALKHGLPQLGRVRITRLAHGLQTVSTH